MTQPTTPMEMVREFHQVYRHPLPQALTTVDDDTARLRIELIREEFEELVNALVGAENPFDQFTVEILRKAPGQGMRDMTLTEVGEYHPDLIETADALADLIYVVCGAAIAHGIDLDAVVTEVHRSNMSKLGEDGQPIRREDGKTLKGPLYFPPDIAKILGVSNEDVPGASL